MRRPGRSSTTLRVFAGESGADFSAASSCIVGGPAERFMKSIASASLRAGWTVVVGRGQIPSS